MTNSRLPSVVSSIPPDLRAFIERVREYQSQPVTSVAKDAIGTVNLVNGAVVPDKIATGAVLAEKIAKDAVTTDKLADGAVTAAKLGVGLDTAPVALGASASAGDAATLSRSNHVHPYPTATNVGAAPAGGALATNWTCAHLRTSTGYIYQQADGGSLVSSISMLNTGVLNRMVFRNADGFQFYGDMSGTTLGDVYAGVYSGTGYYLSGDPDTGIFSGGANILAFETGGTGCAYFDTNGHLLPGTGNTFNLGASGNRWNYIYANNLNAGTILPMANNTYTLGNNTTPRGWANIYYYAATNISDKKEKTDIADGDLGLDFVNALRPVKFRWRTGGHVDTGEKDADGRPILTPRPGVRPHYGLVADEVKAAMGERDFGGYVEDAESGQKGLRWDEIDSVLIKAVQELHVQVKELSVRLEAIERRVAAL